MGRVPGLGLDALTRPPRMQRRLQQAGRRLILLGAWAAVGVVAAAPELAPAPTLGRLLITLPGAERAQWVNLDRPARLSDHADPNAKGARFFDGNRHYFQIQNAGFKQDTLTVFSAATGQAEYVAQGLPRITSADPSPIRPAVFSLVLLDIASDTGVFAVVDLGSGQQVLASYPGEVGQYLHWWMPDGSLRRLHAHTGELSAWHGKLSEAGQRMQWRVIGALPLPEPGVIFSTAALSPNGQALLVSALEPRSRREDLWMASPDGGPLQRVTRDGFVTFVAWAPNGRSLLLRRSNVSSIGTTFRGQCSYWVVPAGARDVAGIVPGVANPGARQVLHGSPHAPDSLPCGKVGAWTQ